MRHGHGVGPGLACDTGQEGVAHLSRRRLRREATLPAIGRNVGPLDGAGMPQLPRQPLDEARVAGGVGAQAVVKVRDVESQTQRALQLRQCQEKRCRVRPAGHRDDDAAAAQSALLQPRADGAREVLFSALTSGRTWPVRGQR